jgi:hypothetical protein
MRRVTYETSRQSCNVCRALFSGIRVFADDMHKDPMSRDNMMKHCMRQQAAANSSMSKSEMKKACEKQMMMMQKEKDSMAQEKPAH